MLNKSGIIISSLRNLHCVYSPSPISKTSLAGLASAQQQQCRAYALVSNSHSRHQHGDLRWPEVTSINAIPSPYQIFNQKKGSKYSKQRFYELVKLYHPDRHDHNLANDGLSYETKVERYRLVVAANDILSDPVKRGAYDCYGAGWNGQPDVLSPRDSSEHSSGWENAKGWAGGPQGPSQNATWEDWERWYQRDAKGAQQATYVSNGAFVALILVFAVLGGIGQFTRVGDYSMKFLAQRDSLHDEMSKELMRRRKETTTFFGSREERINSFLRQRDPIGNGVIDSREESHRKLLAAPEVCRSDDIKSRSVNSHRLPDENRGG